MLYGTSIALAISLVRQSQSAATKAGRSGVEIVAVACRTAMTGRRCDAQLCVAATRERAPVSQLDPPPYGRYTTRRESELAKTLCYR